jgi:hypothetical protein
MLSNSLSRRFKSTLERVRANRTSAKGKNSCIGPTKRRVPSKPLTKTHVAAPKQRLSNFKPPPTSNTTVLARERTGFSGSDISESPPSCESKTLGEPGVDTNRTREVRTKASEGELWPSTINSSSLAAATGGGKRRARRFGKVSRPPSKRLRPVEAVFATKSFTPRSHLSDVTHAESV